MSESIRVALRIRPLVESEISRGCQTCLDVAFNLPQVIVRNEKSFTYNYVFDQYSTQEEVYSTSVKDLVQELFKGFNVTILAYGQTGSGKTHTMGTCYAGEGDMGIIPRAIKDIFDYVDSHNDWDFKVTVSFIELYNEQLYDLLSVDRTVIDIREDTKGIIIPGLTESPVSNSNMTMNCLQQGASGRITGATAMNNQSSRSHAIFTVNIHQQKKDDVNTATSAKFHLVDLAGSERSKKTQAVGERFKEGVNINNGLLHLGNVISALGEGTKQVPTYRNSKLTRLLQDSLGGNSMTLMIACVSPADYNLVETVSTLRYADRAKHIKNKPIVNQDPKSAEIAALKRQIQELQANGNYTACNHEGIEDELRRVNAKLRITTQRLNDALNENTIMCETVLLAENARDKIKQKVAELEMEVKLQIEAFMELMQSNECPDSMKQQLNVLKTSFNVKMMDLRDEHKKSESEMWAHESSNAHLQGLSSSCDDLSAQGELDCDVELDQQQEELVNKQTQLNKELRELTRQLALKEEVCEKYSKTSVGLMAEENLKQSLKLKTEYEKQINDLKKERVELMNSIKQLQSSNKESEIRAKQLELDKKNQEIDILQKKLENQSKIIKQKEAAEKKVVSLSNEITQMKQTKVKLIRQMRSEGEKFRSWKIAREREASKLKDQDRRRQNQIAKMENLHNKQQNVFKRKLEEATACNKRLKEALARQKMAQDRRLLMRGNKEQVQEWVAHELEVLVSTVDAERTLQQLLDDRATLSTDLKNLKCILSDENESPEARAEAEREVAQVNKDLEVRNAQIADLQQKILDSDQENKMNTRWDAVQSMGDAKTALKHAFVLVAEIRKDAITKEYNLKELQGVLEDTKKKKTELEREIRKLKEKHQEELLMLEKEHQEDMNFILCNDDKGEVRSFKNKLNLSNHEDLEKTKGELMKKEEECEQLKLQIATIVEAVKTPKNKRSRKRASFHREFEDLDFDSNDSLIDDEAERLRDPDWRRTPIGKRLQDIKSRPSRISNLGNIFPEKRKRAQDGTFKCGCSTNCNTKKCCCKKMNLECTTSCSCDPQKCNFKLSSFSDSSTSLLNTTVIIDENNDMFKKPRFTYVVPSITPTPLNTNVI